MRGTPGVAWSMAIAVAALSRRWVHPGRQSRAQDHPAVTACHNTLQPVIALTIMIALGESPGIRNLLGSALIMIGGFAAVALSTNDKRAVEAELSPRGRRGGQKLQARRREARDGSERRV